MRPPAAKSTTLIAAALLAHIAFLLPTAANAGFLASLLPAPAAGGAAGGKFKPNCGACMDVVKTYAETFPCTGPGLCGFHCGMLCDKDGRSDRRVQEVPGVGAEPCATEPCKIGEVCSAEGAKEGTVFCKKYGLCPAALACLEYQKKLGADYNGKKADVDQMYERIRCGVRTTEICNQLSSDMKMPFGGNQIDVCASTPFDHPSHKLYSLECVNDPSCPDWESALAHASSQAASCRGCYWAVKTFPLFTGQCMPKAAKTATLTGPDSLGQILENYIEGKDHAEPLRHTKGMVDELRCQFYLNEASKDPIIQPRYMNDRFGHAALEEPQGDPTNPPDEKFVQLSANIRAGDREHGRRGPKSAPRLRGPVGQEMEALTAPEAKFDDCENLKNSNKERDKNCEGESSPTMKDSAKIPKPSDCMDHWWIMSQSMTARGWAERFLNELQAPYFDGFGPKRGASFDGSYKVPAKYHERSARKQCQCMGFCAYLKDEQTAFQDKCALNKVETFQLMRDDYLQQGFRFKMKVPPKPAKPVPAGVKRSDGLPAPVALSGGGVPTWYPKAVDQDDVTALNNVASGGTWEWFETGEYSATKLLRLDEIVTSVPVLAKMAHDVKIKLVPKAKPLARL